MIVIQLSNFFLVFLLFRIRWSTRSTSRSRTSIDLHRDIEVEIFDFFLWIIFSNDRLFRCLDCSKEFSSVKRLIHHRIVHTGMTDHLEEQKKLVHDIKFRSSIGLCAFPTVSKRSGDHLWRPSMGELSTRKKRMKHIRIFRWTSGDRCSMDDESIVGRNWTKRR